MRTLASGLDEYWQISRSCDITTKLVNFSAEGSLVVTHYGTLCFQLSLMRWYNTRTLSSFYFLEGRLPRTLTMRKPIHLSLDNEKSLGVEQ